MRRKTALVVVTALSLLTAACGKSTTGTNTATPAPTKSSYKQGGTVTIANTQGQTWTCQFNPFNPAVNAESLGFIYEPLVYVNLLQNQAETPMLASAYKWSDDKKSVTFTIRDGVTWSDGQPFSADDVVFTFNLMKQTPAVDLYSLWSGAGLQSVSASGNQVTLAFNAVATPYFYNFADQVGIVPKHIFSTGDAAAHPDTWEDKAPVGTGPFKVDPCTPNNIQYTANATYWQKGKPYIQKVEYPAYLDNAPANLDLASGKAQWGSQFIPGIKAAYLDKSQGNNTWSPPVVNVEIFPNLDPSHKVTSQLAVRQAIALGIDRTKISAIGEDGQQPAANQTGVVVPTFSKYYDEAAVKSAGLDAPNADKAKQLLASAGYSAAKPLKLNIITIQGYTDWDASLAVIKQNLAAIGIQINIQDLAQQTYDDKLYKGDYDLAYGSEPAGGPTPYYELRQMLYSKASAKIGDDAASNYVRYTNPDVDKLFDQYPTADDATQVDIIKKIGGHMLTDVPVIPTTESVDWFQYNTADIQGWPTKDNPYCQPAAYNVPDVEQLLLHIYSKSAQ
ncbi:MAG: ABC transporter substrate-binding protein [Actinobacteria bacterium 13_1_20CM_3_71_11]|nr:MAG: ABC transporter substrate-binding protein [Actinobacteria bacterium 13_1_20CM_3_71_11]